jgi:outer membrane protein assembly factor BamB
MDRRLVLVSGLVLACSSPPAASVPTAPGAPWPKLRGDAAQTGRGGAHVSTPGGVFWSFPTGKGVFSSPVVGADGTIYVGSADRTFYALHKDGTLAWSHQTGEIIDSAALLDDQGRVYVGSGDGHLYAFDAATGELQWTFAADAPGPRSIINWFEGNVAIGPDGTLYAGNDNFHVYAVNREGVEQWATDMPDQTWSSPAIDAASGQLYIGNNAMLEFLGANLWSFDRTGQKVWKHSAWNGTVAASPALTDDGGLIVGAFDGYVHDIDVQTNQERWSVPFPTRDHVYASAAIAADGTIVVPSADGTVYALDPATGTQKWAFDTLEPIRSSPAIDADGDIYVGGGDGRLYVINPDGTLRWSMQLISDVRNDLNSSPALGTDAVYIAGESGEVFSVPFDYCMHVSDARCTVGGGEATLPPDGVGLWVTTPLGSPQAIAPHTIDANQPLTLSLVARKGGDTELAVIDSPSVNVTVAPTPLVPPTVDVSADRRFVVITPQPQLGAPGGVVTVHVTATYLLNPDRDGLAFTHGTPAGTIDETFTFQIAPAGTPYALSAPSSTNDASTALEMYRLAAPLPTILPSYNQIGFDSLHYLIGTVEESNGHGVAWVVGGTLDAANNTVVDPATQGLFAVEIDDTNGALTLTNDAGFSLVAMGATLTFERFRVSARLAADGTSPSSPALVVSTQCADIQLYGPFLGQLGLCNPDTKALLVSGGLLLRPWGCGVVHAPGGVGTVAFTTTPTSVVATVTGSTIKTADHALGVLLVDATTGAPLSVGYGLATTRTSNADGTVATVTVALPAGTTGAYRAYLMVDTYPAARATVTL